MSLIDGSALEGIPLDEMRFAVVDVETTGSAFSEGDRITEIAVVHVDRGEVGTVFSTLVNPGRSIPALIQRFTGISDRMVAVAPPFEEVAGIVDAQLYGRVFTAHNAPFDWSFVRRELLTAGREEPEVDRLCTVRMGRHFLPNLQRHGLDALASHYCIPVQGRHRAMGDALATAHILIQLLDLARTAGIADWATLRDTLRGHRKKGARRKRKARRQDPVVGEFGHTLLADPQSLLESE